MSEDYNIVPSYIAVKNEILNSFLKAIDFYEIYIKNLILGSNDIKSLSYFSSNILTCYFKSRYQSRKSFNSLMNDPKRPEFKNAKIILDKIESGERITREEAKIILSVMSNYLFLLGITNIKVSSKNPLSAIEDMG